MKKGMLSLAALTLGLALFAPTSSPRPSSAQPGAILYPAVSLSAKTAIYKYAVIGTTYKVKTGLISAQDPYGNALTDKEVLLYWTFGEYLFEYANSIEHVKVYESKPEDSLRFFGEMPSSFVTGVSYLLPGAEVVSGVKRTNGAPAIAMEEATLEIFDSKGSLLAIASSAGASYTYLFTTPGSYSLSYAYTDAFRDQAILSVPLTVENKAGIVSESLPAETTLYEPISLAEIYGLNEGNHYPVSLSVTTPSKAVLTPTNSLTPSEIGTYMFHLASSIAGSTITKDVAVLVKEGGTALLSARDALDDFACGKVTLPSNVIWGNESGVSFQALETGASFLYAEPVDLAALNGANLIDFVANYDTTDSGITQVDITLIDAYDSSNQFLVRLQENDAAYLEKGNPARDNNIMVYAGVPGDLGGSVYSHSASPSPLKDANGNAYDWGFFVAWEQSLAPNLDTNRTFNPVGFGWDTAKQMAVMDTVLSNSEPSCRVPLYDDASNPYHFAGFAHNKVYVKFSVSAGDGTVLINDIGGVALSSAKAASFTSDASILMENDASKASLTGAVNYRYPLPEVYDYDYVNKRTKATTVSLYYGEEDLSSLIVDHAFTPSKSGAYKAVYSSTNALGIAVKKSVAFTIDDAPTPLTFSAPSLSSKIMARYKIPTFTVSGGNGAITKSLTLQKGTESIAVNEGDTILLDQKTSYAFVLKAEDEIGSSLSQTIPLSVNFDAVYYAMDVFPKCLEVGAPLTLPVPTAIDFAGEGSGTALSCEVQIGGETLAPGASYTPTIPGDFTAKYVVGKGTAREASHSYSYHVRNAGIDTSALSDFFLTTSLLDSSLGENGALFNFKTTSRNASIALPYPTTTSLFALRFAILKDSAKFSDLSLRFTAFNGKELLLKIANATTSTPKLYVNGVNTGITLPLVNGTFPSGELQGKAYQEYTLFLDGGLARIMNANYSTLYEISSWYDEDSFSGFSRGGAYVSFEFSGISGAASFLLEDVGNQGFTSTVLKRGDRTIPQLGFATNFSLEQTAELGSTETLPEAYAYDVLSFTSSVSYTVSDPSGNPVTPENNAFRIDKTGSYSIIYVVSDTHRTSSLYYSVVGIDDVAPTITVESDYLSSYAYLSSVTIANFSVKDNASDSLSGEILLYAPDDSITALTAGSSYTFTLKGTYRLRYLCFDLSGNRAVKEYVISVA
jgi:hypothetical protein